MQDSHIDSEDEENAMARFLGFSSFGAQGPSKKRKFNSKTDAFVAGDELMSLDKGGKTGQGSGGNIVPLGKSRLAGQQPTGLALNSEEIEIEDGSEDGVSSIHVQEYTGSVDQEDEVTEPAYIDTSRPPLLEDSGALEAQAKIDAILAISAQPPSATSSSTFVLPERASEGILVHHLPVLQGLPSSASLPFVPLASSSQETAKVMRERRQHNDLWYIGYYDPSFNENPWAALENENNLNHCGTWIERKARPG